MSDDQVMVRRGITLSEPQWRQLKAWAAAQGLTISQLVARWIDTPRHAIYTDGKGGWFDPAADGRFGVGGTVDESHMEGDVRVIDKVTLMETSLVKDPPSPAQTIRPFTPAPKPKSKR